MISVILALEVVSTYSYIFGIFLIPLVIYLVILIRKVVRQARVIKAGKQSILASNHSQKEGSKNKLVQLITTEKTADIYQVCSVLNTTPEALRQLVNGLVQAGKVSAEFKGDDLIISSGVEEFAALVEQSYAPLGPRSLRKVLGVLGEVRAVNPSLITQIVVVVIAIAVIFVIIGILSSQRTFLGSLY